MANEAYATFRHPAVVPLDQIEPQPIRAGAVSRPDAGVQGRGDAADLAADGPCAGQARPAHHHRGRDLGRYRRRRGRCVRGARQCRSDRAVPERPHLRRAAADDDDIGRCQRARARDRRHFRRLPGDREGAVQSSPAFAMRSRCRASIPSTGRGSWRRWCIISPPRSRSARPRGRWISPCRPEISATSLPATSPSGWACRCAGCASPPTSTTSCRAR